MLVKLCYTSMPVIMEPYEKEKKFLSAVSEQIQQYVKKAEYSDCFYAIRKNDSEIKNNNEESKDLFCIFNVSFTYVRLIFNPKRPIGLTNGSIKKKYLLIANVPASHHLIKEIQKIAKKKLKETIPTNFESTRYSFNKSTDCSIEALEKHRKVFWQEITLYSQKKRENPWRRSLPTKLRKDPKANLATKPMHTSRN